LYLGGSGEVAQVLRCEGEDAGLPEAKEDSCGGPGGSTAKRAVVAYTLRHCCDCEVRPVDFFLNVLRWVHAKNWVKFEAQVYECVGFFEVRLGGGAGERESRGDKELGWYAQTA